MKAALAPGLRQAIAQAAQKGYPDEVCGILLGRLDGGLQVLEAHACPNVNAERARDRYLIDPKAQLAVEKDARRRSLDVVGYYHSHPDHPALASETDQGLSWESALYLIQAVRADGPGELKGWFRPSGQPRLDEVDLA